MHLFSLYKKLSLDSENSPTRLKPHQLDDKMGKEEVFGPVSVVKTFDSEEKVIELANDTEYGLMAAISHGTSIVP